MGVRAGVGITISDFSFDIYYDRKFSDFELKVVQQVSDKP